MNLETTILIGAGKDFCVKVTLYNEKEVSQYIVHRQQSHQLQRHASDGTAACGRVRL